MLFCFKIQTVTQPTVFVVLQARFVIKKSFRPLYLSPGTTLFLPRRHSKNANISSLNNHKVLLQFQWYLAVHTISILHADEKQTQTNCRHLSDSHVCLSHECSKYSWSNYY